MKRLAIGLAFLLVATVAAACECARGVSVGWSIAHAPVIFIGRVESVDDRWSVVEKIWLKVRRFFNESYHPDADWKRYCTDYGMAATFTVERAWKGVSEKRITLLTGRGGGDCGFPFEKGKRYLVYAYPPGADGCQTDICTRTREVEDAAGDLALLNGAH